MTQTQQPEALNLEEFRAKVTRAAREPLLARIAELEAQVQPTEEVPVVPQGWKLVQIELLERIQESLGSFLSDQGWSQSDMDTADALAGLLASTPHLPAQPGWCDGCSPDNCCGCGPSQAGEQS